MLNLSKKIVIDEYGNPYEVIIPWEQFQTITEMLGLDLDTQAIEDLKQARADRENNRFDAYISLDNL
jgi:hypothetical protein